ncbi:hypothetical protein GIB67_027064, partial [Kingdonia uniflora]
SISLSIESKLSMRRRLIVGDDHICGVENVTGMAKCWYRGEDESKIGSFVALKGVKFASIPSGRGFSCGVLVNDMSVRRWESSSIGLEISKLFGNVSMLSLVAGDSHVCGLTVTGWLLLELLGSYVFDAFVGMVGLSIGEKHFIEGGIAQDLRTDGRKRWEYRPLLIETGVIPQASGSARVKMGGTDVIASVKAELGKPNHLHPDKGNVSIFVDCSPTAAPMFEGRGGEELSAEISLALQRCLLGGSGINLSSLIVAEGKICWDLYIDGLVVSSDGNLLDALSAAIKAALSNIGIPKVNVAIGASADEQPEVDISDEDFLQFDTSEIPVIITLTKIGGQYYIVDATTEEESQMSSAISVSINRRGHICRLTKRGGAGLDPSVILDFVSVAKRLSEQVMTRFDSEISAAEAYEGEARQT